MTAPMLTVSDSILIDNNVAIPLIFPGPLLVLPNATPISEQGEQAIVDQARELGLLDGPTDFTGGGVMPGGVTGNVLLVVDGTDTSSPATRKRCACATTGPARSIRAPGGVRRLLVAHAEPNGVAEWQARPKRAVPT
jgi:hypothetical protein